MKPLIKHPEWGALQSHQQQIAGQTMQQWFADDPERFSLFSLRVNNVLLDYSKNLIKPETMQLLCRLAQKANLKSKISNLFSGSPVNTTEKRPVLHTALRDSTSASLFVANKDILPDIQATLAKMHHFTAQIRNQEWRGVTGKPIRDIVNIGIGGSHLGPMMALNALSDFADDNLRCHFVSNIDKTALNEILNQIHPEQTLFIISSKSFTTLETLTNARTIRGWLEAKLGTNNLTPHFVAVTASIDKALEFGIPEEQIFALWDWVGGRYSVWSAIGLPLAIMIGMDNFYEFLAGAHDMDLHFRDADFSVNMPVILGLLGIWYINFFGALSHGIIPYSHYLNHFRAYLQQLDMESNGKRISHQGEIVDYVTGPIIFGEHGCNGQHAFHQLLHQGQHLVPVDFILVGEHHNSFSHHQDILIASALSQAQALMKGKNFQQALDELIAEGHSQQEAELLASHKMIPGNRPSNILFIDKMTPRNLGSLLALYEHKIFVQGALWDINSFDQWGVELGKQLLGSILHDLKNASLSSQYDASTLGLIQHYKNLRGSE